MFKRGPGPLISVLFPTRNRPELACEAIYSLVSTCTNPKNLEFIFKIDSDDIVTLPILLRYCESMSYKIIISPRGNGYKDMHHWVNDMSAISSGDWLMIFNDDARMTSKGWDSIVENTDPYYIPGFGGSYEICLFIAISAKRLGAWEFPILRREVYKLLGHYSLSPHNDNWIYSVMNKVNAAISLNNVIINHFSEKMTDSIRQESEATYQITVPILNSPEMCLLKERDVQILRSYLKNTTINNHDWSGSRR